MNKNNADKLALIMARDVLKTSSEQHRKLNEFTAEELANFIAVLSKRLQDDISEEISIDDVIYAHKVQ